MFNFKLVLEDGTPADPPTFSAAVPNWKPVDTIPLGLGARCASSRFGRAYSWSSPPERVEGPGRDWGCGPPSLSNPTRGPYRLPR